MNVERDMAEASVSCAFTLLYYALLCIRGGKEYIIQIRIRIRITNPKSQILLGSVSWHVLSYIPLCRYVQQGLFHGVLRQKTVVVVVVHDLAYAGKHRGITQDTQNARRSRMLVDATMDVP